MQGSSVYYGFLGATSGSPANEGEEACSRIVIGGFSVFCLLLAASYTGATAAMLVEANQRGSDIKGIEDIVATPGGKVCVYKAFQARFNLRFPEFGAARLVVGGTAEEVLQDIDDGKCLGAMLFRDAWDSARAGKIPTKQNDGDTVYKNHCKTETLSRFACTQRVSLLISIPFQAIRLRWAGLSWPRRTQCPSAMTCRRASRTWCRGK